MNSRGSQSGGGTLSLSEYAAELQKDGEKILGGSEGTIWGSYGSGSMARLPTFHLAMPDPWEIRKLFWNRRALVITYNREPDDDHPANAFLYICSDKSYSLNKLGKGTRWSVKKGFKELRVSKLTNVELLDSGLQAFCDTRSRLGLNDGTTEVFRKRFAFQVRNPGHVFIGAWKGNQLAAFLSLIEVSDWIEIEGSFSMNEFRKSCPNDTLIYYLLTHYLVENDRSVISYGLSSIQSETNEAGLHSFKTKIGFEAKPVHRAFVIHPLFRPFAGKLALWGINTALRMSLGNPLLKKTAGMLALLQGGKSYNERAVKK